MSSTLHPPSVLLLCGSLRRDSLNARLLALAPRLAPPGMQFVVDEALRHLPLYDEDLDGAEVPASVAAFRAALAACEGVVVASPEYNHSIAAPLKNAIDWASRPYGRAAFGGKCVVVWTATKGGGLGFEGLAHTQHVLQAMNNFVVQSPRVAVHRAHEKLTQERGEVQLHDPVALSLMRAQLAALAEACAADAGALCTRGPALV